MLSFSGTTELGEDLLTCVDLLPLARGDLTPFGKPLKSNNC